MKEYTPNSSKRRFFSQEDSEKLGEYVLSLARSGKGSTTVDVLSRWTANIRWARNSVSVMSERRNAQVRVTRIVEGSSGSAVSNQVDGVSLRAMIDRANWVARVNPSTPIEPEYRFPGPAAEKTYSWDDETFQQDGKERGMAVTSIIEKASSEGAIASGFVQISALSRSTVSSEDNVTYYLARTEAECSVTVRDWRYRASGWAGNSSYSWSRLNPQLIGSRAVEKCLKSRDPVAIEPGRYATILEPQATYDLIGRLFGGPNVNERLTHELPLNPTPWFQEVVTGEYLSRPMKYGLSKIGQRVFDTKITIEQIPAHPDMGTWAFDKPDYPYGPVVWIKEGVIHELPGSRRYVSDVLTRNDRLGSNGTFLMHGGESDLEDMVSGTRRGLLVSRLSNITAIDKSSGLVSCFTRDGLWLIENGKITKSVKNFRVLDSPYFIFNDVESLGKPTSIFMPIFPAIVPPVKVREMNFVSLADAV